MKTIFYSLLLTFLLVALTVGINIGTCKLFGWTCNIASITFSLTFTLIWLYFHNEVEKFTKEWKEEEGEK